LAVINVKNGKLIHCQISLEAVRVLMKVSLLRQDKMRSMNWKLEQKIWEQMRL